MARQPSWVALTVPPLVVLPHRPRRVAQPIREGADELTPEVGVLLHDLELGRRERAGLVEDVGRHEQLADVVQHRRPPQAIQLAGVETELLADHVGVATNPLAVPTGQPIVEAERADELEQLLGRLRGRATDLSRTSIGDHLAELQRRRRADREPEPRRRPIRETPVSARRVRRAEAVVG